MHTRFTLGIATAGMLTLALTGCFGNPVENVIEGAIKQQTGVDIDVSTGETGSSAKLPDSWPGLPLPPGDLIASFSADGSYIFTLIAADEQSVLAIVEEYLSLGYELKAETSMGELESRMLSNEEWMISLGWAPDESTGKIAVNYGAVPNRNG